MEVAKSIRIAVEEINNEVTSLAKESKLILLRGFLIFKKKDYDMAYDEANKLMRKLKNNKTNLEQFTNKYLKEFEDCI